MPVPVPTGLVEPLAQYDHSEGISVIGGKHGRLMHLLDAIDERLPRLGAKSAIAEFKLDGQAAVGLSVLANSTGVPSGTTGVVLKLVPAGVTAGDDDDGPDHD